MASIEFKTAVAMGDLILVYSLMEQIKNKYSEIRLCPDYSLIDLYRKSSKENLAFSKQMVALIFDAPYYKILDKSNEKVLYTANLANKLHLRTKYVDLRSKLCLPTKVDIGTDNYIVVHTKIRDLSQPNFELVRKQAYDMIRNTKKKIVIMGERFMDKGASVTIYNDLMGLVKGKDYLDLTKETIIFDPDINMLRRDSALIRDSKGLITFGICGGVVFGSIVSNIMAGFRKDDAGFWNWFDKGVNANKLITSDTKAFLDMVRKITQ
jgi:hypothetical protein